MVKQKVPEPLLTCTDEPPLVAVDPRQDLAAQARHISKLFADVLLAGRDCRDALARVRQWSAAP